MASNKGSRVVEITVAVFTIIATILTLVGLAQLDPVRNFACAHASILCKRDYIAEIFKISYFSPKIQSARTTAWQVLVDDTYGHNADSSEMAECIEDDNLRRFLQKHNAVFDKNISTITLEDQGESKQSRWILDVAPLRAGGDGGAHSVGISDHDNLVMHLDIQYMPLVRDMQLDIDATLDDGYREYPKYEVHRVITLTKGSRDRSVICELPFPGPGVYNFKFHFRDDVWDSDPSLNFSLDIDNDNLSDFYALPDKNIHDY